MDNTLSDHDAVVVVSLPVTEMLALASLDGIRDGTFAVDLSGEAVANDEVGFRLVEAAEGYFRRSSKPNAVAANATGAAPSKSAASCWRGSYRTKADVQ